MVKEGSYMYYISDDKSIIRQSFDLDESQGAFSPMTVSRKKQIVPMITNTLELI
jgi:inorganic diphosphatase ppaC